MNTVKDSLLLKDHYPGVEIYVFYIDMRAFGKGFEDLLSRSRKAGGRYIRGMPGDIAEDRGTRNLLLKVENTTAGRVEEFELDLVVVSVGLEPRQDGDHLRRMLALSQTSDGFLAECHPKLKPVDTATRGVFLAGCVEAPKDIKDSVTQASAAVARAEVILKAGRIKIEATTAVVDKEKCIYCEVCTRVCPYGAISADRKNKIPANIIEAMCAGCGTCAAECQFDALSMRHSSDEQIMAQVEAALEENPREKIIAFACNWCSYAAGDVAGVSRMQYPPSARIIRTMCSGRVDERFVLRAFQLGAPLVLLSGCHFADCHYINANRWTQRRVDRLWNRLERLGIRPERLQLEWISAAEGQRFVQVMAELEQMRAGVSPQEIEHATEVLGEALKKGAAD